MKSIVDNSPVWIDVNCTGEMTGTQYSGRFSVRRYLTRQELADVARLSDQLNRGIVSDVVTIKVMDILARLQYHIVETDASWWDKKDGGLNLPDDEPIYKIYEEVLAAAKAWQKPEPEKSKE